MPCASAPRRFGENHWGALYFTRFRHRACLPCSYPSTSRRPCVHPPHQYSNGETESILGRILPALEGSSSQKVQLATKAAPWGNLLSGAGGVHGASGGAGGLSPELLRMQLEASLKRLGVPSVKLFYLHAPDTETPLEATLLEVKRLHEEGKFEELGVSNYSAWETVHVWHLCDKLGVIKPTVYVRACVRASCVQGLMDGASVLYLGGAPYSRIACVRHAGKRSRPTPTPFVCRLHPFLFTLCTCLCDQVPGDVQRHHATGGDGAVPVPSPTGHPLLGVRA